MEQTARQLTEEIADRIVHLEQRMDAAIRENRARIEQMEAAMDDLGVRMHFMVSLVTQYAEDLRTTELGAGLAPLPLPGSDLPCPRVLKAACAADPAAGVQRIQVDVYGRNITYRVQPGSDPDEVWRGLCQNVARSAMERNTGARNGASR